MTANEEATTEEVSVTDEVVPANGELDDNNRFRSSGTLMRK